LSFIKGAEAVRALMFASRNGP